MPRSTRTIRGRLMGRPAEVVVQSATSTDTHVFVSSEAFKDNAVVRLNPDQLRELHESIGEHLAALAPKPQPTSEPEWKVGALVEVVEKLYSEHLVGSRHRLVAPPATWAGPDSADALDRDGQVWVSAGQLKLCYPIDKLRLVPEPATVTLTDNATPTKYVAGTHVEILSGRRRGATDTVVGPPEWARRFPPRGALDKDGEVWLAAGGCYGPEALLVLPEPEAEIRTSSRGFGYAVGGTVGSTGNSTGPALRFKIGDRVRVTGQGNGSDSPRHCHAIGAEGVVVGWHAPAPSSAGYDGSIHVTVDGLPQYVAPRHLEKLPKPVETLAGFRVGDRVKVLDDGTRFDLEHFPAVGEYAEVKRLVQSEGELVIEGPDDESGEPLEQWVKLGSVVLANTFEVGDRVVTRCSTRTTIRGDLIDEGSRGVVDEIHDADVSVRWDGDRPPGARSSASCIVPTALAHDLES